MPWQLIYTSAPRGLVSGQSGFCTVARSGDLREALAQRLEQLSYYHYLRVAEAATANRNPTVCAFRILDLRGTKYHVLTRIQPCGLDFTARTNHLAHHLVFESGELAQLPSPAAILRHWSGWMSSWQGEPRLLEDPALNDFGAAAAKPCLPAQTWLQITGDAGRAAGLLESECVRGCYLVCPAGSEGQVLQMFSETLQLLNPNGQYALRPWRHTFTNFLQAEDNPADFQWRACQEGTPAWQQAVQRTAALTPLRSVRVPTNSLIKLAREGLKPPPPATTPSPAPAQASSQTTLTLRRQARDKRPDADWPDTSHWGKTAEKPKESESRDINVSIPVLRLGIFAAVLLALLAVRIWLFKPHAPLEAVSKPPPAESNPAPPSTASIKPSAPPSRYQTAPVQATTLDPAQLQGLSGDEPTYIFTAPNLIHFTLPISSISRFERLIQRFEQGPAPSDLHASVGVDEWDFTGGAASLSITRQDQTLSAKAADGEYVFDYANWSGNPIDPIDVHTSFTSPPRSFSIEFGFGVSNHSDPFRLLIVNENNPPPPLRLSKRWLRPNGKGLVASLQEPLGQRIQGGFNLLGNRVWQLRPFVKSGDEHRPHYLYQNWPAPELPPPGDELDFAELKDRLAAQQLQLNNLVTKLDQLLAAQIQQADLDRPLGKWIAPTNENLQSFFTFASRLSLTRPKFIKYLNALDDADGSRKWPVLKKDDDEGALQAKFQTIYDWWSRQHHDAVGDTNYFAGVWDRLQSIEINVRQEQRAQNEFDKVQERLNAVPATLDEVAYVGLFILDPPWPTKLEMIRFDGP